MPKAKLYIQSKLSGHMEKSQAMGQTNCKTTTGADILCAAEIYKLDFDMIRDLLLTRTDTE